MVSPRQATADGATTGASARRADWLGDAVVSGFIATFAMTVIMAGAYGLAHAIGDETGSRLERWFWALAHNPVTRTTEDWVVAALAINLLTGLLWTLLYGYDAEPRLSGPGWRKGMLFAIGPWLLSIVAFLPIMGGGLLGTKIDAGPLPIVGNLILHLVFGVVLGTVYAIELEAWLDGSEADRAHADAQQRGAAFGIVGGLIVGTLFGWLLGPSLDDLGSRALITLMGALIGGAAGLILGSFVGAELLGSTRRMRTVQDRLG